MNARLNSVPSASLRRFPLRTATPRFGGPLADKYHINLDEVQIVGKHKAELPVGKEELVERTLEAHEHALKNKAVGNYSGYHVASNMRMNGRWNLGANIELTRDSGLCGERSALINSWNRFLEESPLKKLESKPDIKADIVTISTGFGIYKPIAPCSECQSWMSTEKYFSPETFISALKRDENDKPVLQVRQMKELLPLKETMQASRSDTPITDLTLSLSDNAETALKTLNVSQEELRSLLITAKRRYEENQASPHSKKNTGTAVQLSDGRRESAARLDWTARWYEAPDLQAASEALQKSLQLQAVMTRLETVWEALPKPAQRLLEKLAQRPRAQRMQERISRYVSGFEAAIAHKSPRIEAIAYYGDTTDNPEVKNLGILAQETWGGKDTLIAVIENDAIQVRTIDDYMTDIYISKSSHAKQQ